MYYNGDDGKTVVELLWIDFLFAAAAEFAKQNTPTEPKPRPKHIARKSFVIVRFFIQHTRYAQWNIQTDQEATPSFSHGLCPHHHEHDGAFCF